MNGQPDIGAAVAALDQAMKALVLAKSALLGQGGAALLISSDLAAAEASPGNPYGGQAKHGQYDAASAAEVAEGVEPEVTRCRSCGHTILKRTDGHGWVHADGLFAAVCIEGSPEPAPNYGLAAEVAEGAEPAGHVCGDSCAPAPDWDPAPLLIERDEPHPEGELTPREVLAGYTLGPDLCPAKWGVPPETMLCSQPSGHHGNHATAEGIEWGGKWETAEPPAKGDPR